ncbi:methyltransferase domain-containing protein [Candidatus Woesearchaeota archaeon]|nr:methyltransferase domain-containing protein [Candidatus Woesearchaeota archaeon]
MRKIITADGTETFLNEQVQETYHSQTGAVEEALKKYAIPCKTKELARTGKITILDVCSGMGYNEAMAIDVALEENPDCEIEVIGLESDPKIIEKIQEVDPPIKFFKYYKKISLGAKPRSSERNFLFRKSARVSEERKAPHFSAEIAPSRRDFRYRRLTQKNLELREGKVKVKIILGDARETCRKLPKNYFDAIFFDPFSPKSSPEMWGEAFFKEMYRVLKPTGILATFSCAQMARDNMAKAGLFYDDGPIVGRRGPGTIAVKWTI